MKLDRKSEKKVPVSLNITGALLEDYNYAVDSIVPAEVRITGPESILRRVKMIQASPIVLGKVNVEDFECVLKLRIGPNVSISQSSVTVKVDIFKKFDSRTFDSLTIKPFGFLPASSRKLEFDVKTASIRVSGHKQAVELLIADDLHPFVDISKIDKLGEYTLSVQCWSNIENISVKEIRPKTIQVTVH